MNELNKKLAEWAGFRPTSIEDMWAFPEGSKVAATHSSCKFTQSLDACFKWLVPKLYRWGLSQKREDKVVVAVVSNGNRNRIGTADTPALALCLAIEKLIDEEKK